MVGKTYKDNPHFEHILPEFLTLLILCQHPLMELAGRVKSTDGALATVAYILRRAHNCIVPYMLHQMEYHLLPYPSFLWPTFQKWSHCRRLREEVWWYIFKVGLDHVDNLNGVSKLLYDKYTDFRLIAATQIAVLQHYKDNEFVRTNPRSHIITQSLRLIDIVIPGIVVTIPGVATSNQDPVSSIVPRVNPSANRIVDLTGSDTQLSSSSIADYQANIAKLEKELAVEEKEKFRWFSQYKHVKLQMEKSSIELRDEIKAQRNRITALEKDNDYLRSHQYRDNGRRGGSRSRSKSPDRVPRASGSVNYNFVNIQNTPQYPQGPK